MSEKEIKVTFAPGAFDTFDGTQEELDTLMADIMEMFKTGDFKDNVHLITEDEFDELPDEVKQQLTSGMEPVRTLQ